MSTRSRRGEPIPEIPIPLELQDKKPKKVKEPIPESEYIRNPECESDADGLKGEVFLNYVYRQLVSGSNDSSSASADKPTVYIMVGPPASGKSTIKKRMNINNYVNIDLDEIKKVLTKCFPNDSSLQGFAVIGYLKRFARDLLQLAIKNQVNILFDTTGRMTDLTTEIIEATREAGYKQVFVIVYAALVTVLERAKARNRIETDRPPMSSRAVMEGYESFMNKGASTGTASYYLLSKPELTNEAEELYIYDNNGAEPELLFSRKDGVVEVAKDTPIFYNMSIYSSEPYFSLKGKSAATVKRKVGGTVKRRSYNCNKKISRKK
jgi:predicted ABC-type ATPase